MLIAVAVVMFVVIVACNWWFGLWSNLITLINLLIAAMVASSVYPAIWTKLVVSFPSRPKFTQPNQFFFEFLSVWIAFVMTYIILRASTDFLSGYRMKFDPITERIGRSILSIWIACVFICFSFYTLQMAAISPLAFGNDSFVRQANLGVGPDKLWLAFIQSRSRGALSSSKAAGIFPEYLLEPHADDLELDARVFDPHATFLEDRDSRREFIVLSAIEAAAVRRKAAENN